MTEQEAKTTRCCGPSGCGYQNGLIVQRDASGEVVSAEPERWCIGSTCMAWRWNYVEMDRLGVPLPDPRPVRSYDKDDGFCGLAGKP